MSRKNSTVMIIALAILSGCGSLSPRVDRHYGEALAHAKAAQTVNPEPAPQAEAAAGLDGKAAKEAVDRYVDSFKAPPPTFNVINIGAGR